MTRSFGGFACPEHATKRRRCPRCPVTHYFDHEMSTFREDISLAYLCDLHDLQIMLMGESRFI